MIRVVLDTNIVISALFWKGLPRIIFDAALDKQFISLTSEAITVELRRVLLYPKFAGQVASHELTIDRLVDDYLSIAVAVLPASILTGIVRDPKDQMILACAVGGRADYIVSGDKDLLILGEYVGIPIFSPDNFLPHLSL